MNDVIIDGVRSTVGVSVPEGAQVVATRGGVATAKMGLDQLFSGSQVTF